MSSLKHTNKTNLNTRQRQFEYKSLKCTRLKQTIHWITQVWVPFTEIHKSNKQFIETNVCLQTKLARVQVWNCRVMKLKKQRAFIRGRASALLNTRLSPSFLDVTNDWMSLSLTFLWSVAFYYSFVHKFFFTYPTAYYKNRRSKTRADLLGYEQAEEMNFQ